MNYPKRFERAPEPVVEPEVARRILDAIASLTFGAVEVTVHDGRVVQIDKRERTRISGGRTPEK